MSRTPEEVQSFHLVSLGCPKNRVDSERIASVMIEAGFEMTDDPSTADVLVVNTCSFIIPAVEESLDTILDLHQENPHARLVVAGCLPLRYRDGLSMELPEVDLYLDPVNIGILPAMLKALSSGADPDPPIKAPDISGPLPTRRVLSTTGYAYLRVAEGCSRGCSYCTIPKIRGPLKSVDIDELHRETEVLARLGTREVVLVAQDLTAFGRDRGGKAGLVDLLRSLDQVDGIRWIRLMYLYPGGIPEELPSLINGSDKILPYLDVPFQHVSERVLRAMGRPWKGDRPWRLVEKLRKDIPGLVLRTTFIVGFPAETAADFSELRDFVGQARIEHVGVFTYSAEEGTRAAELGDPIHEDAKAARADEIREVHSAHTQERNLGRVGSLDQAIVEGVASETDLLLQGRMWDQAPEVDGVTYITEGTATAGEIHTLRITGTHGPDLFGEIVPDHVPTKPGGPRG